MTDAAQALSHNAASTTYCMYRDLTKPSVVEHAVKACFTSSGAQNLIVAKTTVLEVFELDPDLDSYAPEGGAGANVPLRRVGEYTLFGRVQSMAAVRFRDRSTDSLVVAFAEARLSVLHFDPGRRTIITLGIHSMEDLKKELSLEMVRETRPICAVDPENRCVALAAYDNHVWVFPTQTAPSAAAAVHTAGGSGKASAGQSPLGVPHVIPLAALGCQALRVVDVVFLAGYLEPCLALLVETGFVWAGRYATARNTCALVLVSLSATERVIGVTDLAFAGSASGMVRPSPPQPLGPAGAPGAVVHGGLPVPTKVHTFKHDIVSRLVELPHDAFAVLPLPAPAVGGLVLAACSVLHFTETAVDYVFAVNEHGLSSSLNNGTTRHPPPVPMPPVGGAGISLAHAHACVLADSDYPSYVAHASAVATTAADAVAAMTSAGVRRVIELLLCLEDGRAGVFTIGLQGLNVRAMAFVVTGNVTAPACVVTVRRMDAGPASSAVAAAAVGAGAGSLVPSAPSAPSPSSAALVFLGSRLQDSLLLAVRRTLTTDEAVAVAPVAGAAGSGDGEGGDSRVDSRDVEDGDVDAEVDGDGAAGKGGFGVDADVKPDGSNAAAAPAAAAAGAGATSSSGRAGGSLLDAFAGDDDFFGGVFGGTGAGDGAKAEGGGDAASSSSSSSSSAAAGAAGVDGFADMFSSGTGTASAAAAAAAAKQEQQEKRKNAAKRKAAAAAAAQAAVRRPLHLRVLDCIANQGPLSDVSPCPEKLTLSAAMIASPALPPNADELLRQIPCRTSVVAAAGFGQGGALVRAREGLSGTTTSRVDATSLGPCRGMWVLRQTTDPFARGRDGDTSCTVSLPSSVVQAMEALEAAAASSSSSSSTSSAMAAAAVDVAVPESLLAQAAQDGAAWLAVSLDAGSGSGAASAAAAAAAGIALTDYTLDRQLLVALGQVKRELRRRHKRGMDAHLPALALVPGPVAGVKGGNATSGALSRVVLAAAKSAPAPSSSPAAAAAAAAAASAGAAAAAGDTGRSDRKRKASEMGSDDVAAIPSSPNLSASSLFASAAPATSAVAQADAGAGAGLPLMDLLSDTKLALAYVAYEAALTAYQRLAGPAASPAPADVSSVAPAAPVAGAFASVLYSTDAATHLFAPAVPEALALAAESASALAVGGAGQASVVSHPEVAAALEAASRGELAALPSASVDTGAASLSAGFRTALPTIAAGNVFGSLFAQVQVTPRSIRLLAEGTSVLCDIPVDDPSFLSEQDARALAELKAALSVAASMGGSGPAAQTPSTQAVIVDAVVCDPFVTVRLSTGSIKRVTFNADPLQRHWYELQDLSPALGIEPVGIARARIAAITAQDPADEDDLDADVDGDVPSTSSAAMEASSAASAAGALGNPDSMMGDDVVVPVAPTPSRSRLSATSSSVKMKKASGVARLTTMAALPAPCPHSANAVTSFAVVFANLKGLFPSADAAVVGAANKAAAVLAAVAAGKGPHAKAEPGLTPAGLARATSSSAGAASSLMADGFGDLFGGDGPAQSPASLLGAATSSSAAGVSLGFEDLFGDGAGAPAPASPSIGGRPAISHSGVDEAAAAAGASSSAAAAAASAALAQTTSPEEAAALSAAAAQTAARVGSKGDVFAHLLIICRPALLEMFLYPSMTRVFAGPSPAVGLAVIQNYLADGCPHPAVSGSVDAMGAHLPVPPISAGETPSVVEIGLMRPREAGGLSPNAGVLAGAAAAGSQLGPMHLVALLDSGDVRLYTSFDCLSPAQARAVVDPAFVRLRLLGGGAGATGGATVPAPLTLCYAGSITDLPYPGRALPLRFAQVPHTLITRPLQSEAAALESIASARRLGERRTGEGDDVDGDDVDGSDRPARLTAGAARRQRTERAAARESRRQARDTREREINTRREDREDDWARDREAGLPPAEAAQRERLRGEAEAVDREQEGKDQDEADEDAITERADAEADEADRDAELAAAPSALLAAKTAAEANRDLAATGAAGDAVNGAAASTAVGDLLAAHSAPVLVSQAFAFTSRFALPHVLRFPLARRITYFDDVAGHSGAFVTGPRPIWVLAVRHGLRTHAALPPVDAPGAALPALPRPDPTRCLWGGLGTLASAPLAGMSHSMGAAALLPLPMGPANRLLVSCVRGALNVITLPQALAQHRLYSGLLPSSSAAVATLTPTAPSDHGLVSPLPRMARACDEAHYAAVNTIAAALAEVSQTAASTAAGPAAPAQALSIVHALASAAEAASSSSAASLSSSSSHSSSSAAAASSKKRRVAVPSPAASASAVAASLRSPSAVVAFGQSPLASPGSVTPTRCAPAAGLSSMAFVNTDSRLVTSLVSLGATALYAAYHPPTHTVAVVITRFAKGFSYEDVSPLSLPVFDLQYEIVFFDATDWAVLTRYDSFEPTESPLGLTISPFTVRQHSSSAGNVAPHTKTLLFLPVTTHSEQDVATKGKVLIIEPYFSMGVSHTGETQRFLKLKTVSHKEFSPVTAIGVVDDMLAVCTGPRLFLYAFDGEKLEGRAFLETEYMTVGIKSLKNYLAIGDIRRSMQLVVWDQRSRNMHVVGKDDDQVEVLSFDFVIDHGLVSIAVTDSSRNVQLLRYLPHRADRIGRRLTPRADFHVGSRVTRLMSLRQATSSLVADSALTTLATSLAASHFAPLSRELLSRREQPGAVVASSASLASEALASTGRLPPRTPVARTMMIGATQDGHLIALSPVDQQLIRRLTAVHSQLSSGVGFSSKDPSSSGGHLAGLNPRGFRLYNGAITQHREGHRKDILDAELVEAYLSLDLMAQSKIAHAIGVTPRVVIDLIQQYRLASQLVPTVW